MIFNYSRTRIANSSNSKLDGEEEKTIEEVRRAISEAKAEEKRLQQQIDRRKEYVARFVTIYGSPIVKDE